MGVRSVRLFLPYKLEIPKEETTVYADDVTLTYHYNTHSVIEFWSFERQIKVINKQLEHFLLK